MALILLAETKDYLGIDSSVTDQDASLQVFIDAVDTQIKRYVRRNIEQFSDTVFLNGQQQARILLGHYPLTAVSLLEVDSDNDFTSPETIDPQDFIFEEAGIIALKNSVFPYGVENVKVTFTAGFNPVPSDIKLAAFMMVELYYLNRSQRNVNKASKSKQGESVTYQKGMPEEVIQLLAPYVREDWNVGVQRNV